MRGTTEDVVSSEKDDCGVIKQFRVTSGRSSDFIEDFDGNKLALSCFLSRHHRIYNHVDFIQIHQ